MTIQNYDIKRVDPVLLRKLRNCSFGETGWMMGCVKQIRKGYWWDVGLGFEDVPVKYNRGRALVIFEGTRVIAWALVRIPAERFYVRGKTGSAVGGIRPDFMVHVNERYRRRGLARKLLVAAYNAYGRLDVYPHDTQSKHFFRRNARFCVHQDTRHGWSSARYLSREISR